MRFRNVLITIYDKTIGQIKELITEDKFQYAVYQEEVCPTTSKKHIQFYGELLKQLSMKQLKKIFNDETIHIEARMGSQQQAIEYCSKELSRSGDSTEHFGIPKAQGTRTDLNNIRKQVKEGIKLTIIIDEMELVNYQAIKCAQTLKTIYSRPRAGKPYVLWLYGDTGLGKTRFVYENYKDIYTKDLTKWWDGYEQNETILIDDYRKDFCKFHELLTLIDRYPCRREVKGGSIHINSKHIIFTSPNSPLDTWDNRTDEDIAQLTRRIDEIREIL